MTCINCGTANPAKFCAGAYTEHHDECCDCHEARGWVALDAERAGCKCPHTTKPNPGPCSQCIGAPVHRCEFRPDGSVTDGVNVRPFTPKQTASAGYKRSAQRGGRATARRTGRV